MPESVYGGLTVDLTDGPNPIGTALLRLQPAGGYLREVFGLGQLELVVGVEPDAVHDPVQARVPRPSREDPIPPEGYPLLISATPTGSIDLRLRRQL